MWGEGGGGGLNWREGRAALVHKRGRKYQHDWLYLQSINSVKHLWRRQLGFGVFIVIWSMCWSESGQTVGGPVSAAFDGPGNRGTICQRPISYSARNTRALKGQCPESYNKICWDRRACVRFKFVDRIIHSWKTSRNAIINNRFFLYSIFASGIKRQFDRIIIVF